MLFVPGDNAAALSTAFIYKPDSVMFDLEDAVSTREKDSARLLVFQALRHPAYKEIETVVRVNALNTEFGLKDLEAAVRGGADIVRLPKTENAEAIHELEAHVLRIEKACERPVGDTKQVFSGFSCSSGSLRSVHLQLQNQNPKSLRMLGER